MASLEMLMAPSDCVRVDVNSMELRPTAGPKKPSDGAAAATPKIQHAARIRKIHPHVVDVLPDEVCAACANS